MKNINTISILEICALEILHLGLADIRIFKAYIYKLSSIIFQRANMKGAHQAVQVFRLSCIFIVNMEQNQIFLRQSSYDMHGYRKFCQRGSNLISNFYNVFFYILRGRGEELNTAICGLSSTRQRNAI